MILYIILAYILILLLIEMIHASLNICLSDSCMILNCVLQDVDMILNCVLQDVDMILNCVLQDVDMIHTMTMPRITLFLARHLEYKPFTWQEFVSISGMIHTCPCQESHKSPNLILACILGKIMSRCFDRERA